MLASLPASKHTIGYVLHKLSVTVVIRFKVVAVIVSYRDDLNYSRSMFHNSVA